MAIANLHLSLVSNYQQQSYLNLLISQLQTQKNLAVYSQADASHIKAQDQQELRNKFKELYENDEDLQNLYIDYTKMPDFEEEMDKITAEYQEELEDLNAWETQIDAQITASSAELEELKAYYESIKSMLSSNIQNDYNYANGS